jgi:hypothetical protein
LTKTAKVFLIILIAILAGVWIYNFCNKWIIEQERQEFRKEAAEANLPKSKWTGYECKKDYEGNWMCRTVATKGRWHPREEIKR